MMKRLNSIETATVVLEIGECDCGYHFGVDASYLVEVGDFSFPCPACKIEIDTAKLFPEETDRATTETAPAPKFATLPR